MSKTIGIDLGTTNSCVSVMEGGKETVIQNSEGSRTTPSIVAVTKNGERLVGEPAKRQAITNPENTVISVKRKMGTDERISLAGKSYTPQEISAMILQKLKGDAESYLGTRVDSAVITCPAYYDDAQRNAVKTAGKIAGLEVKRIINEPTAAALAYGVDKDRDEKVMVYDLGGGTFDVSILEIGDGVIEVMSTAGDTHLGGDDIDRKVSDYIMSDFRNREGIDLSGDKMAMQRIREASEKAKKELSSSMTTNINLPFITASSDGPKHLDMELTRARFEELAREIIEKTEQPVRKALSDAGLSPSDIGKVLLVGGSTRIPAVQEKVRNLMGKEPSRELNPDECVAIGASIQGSKLDGDSSAKEVLLLDVTPLSLSIETLGGVSTKLIERNTTIPVQKSQIFSTAEDGQSSVDINVLQGERQFAKDNRSIGRFRLDGLPPAKRGVPQIEVTFDIDANGILNVTAKDMGTGKAQHVTITAGSNMSDSDVDKAVREAKEFESEDRKRKEGIDALNEADSMMFQTENAMKEAGEKLPESDKSEVRRELSSLRALVEEARKKAEPLTESETTEIRSAKDRLTESAQKLFARMYEGNPSSVQQPGNFAGSGHQESGASPQDDDVVDADYKEV